MVVVILLIISKCINMVRLNITNYMNKLKYITIDMNSYITFYIR